MTGVLDDDSATGVDPSATLEPDVPRVASRTARWAAAGMATAAALVYVAFSWSQWRRWESPSWDLSIFAQLARRYAHLEAPIVTVKGADFNLLGDHFHPLLATLGIPYAIFPSAFTLLVVQALLFAVSVYVITRHAIRVVGLGIGLALGAAYSVSFGLVGAVAVQFHEIAFAVPLLAFSLVALTRERWVACAAWAAPLVLVKEDLGLTVVAIGLVLAWRSRERIGLWLAAWGAVWLVLTTKVLIPAMSKGGQWDYAGKIDLRHLVTHPWDAAIWFVDDGRKVITVLLLVAITGVIGLRSPLMLVAIPTLLWRMWSSNYGYWGHTWHYSAVLMPIAFVAMLDGIQLAGASPRAWLRRAAVMAPAVAVTVAVMLVPQLDIHRLGDPEFWRLSDRDAEARQVLALIPDDAVVESDIGLMSHVVDRTDVYYMGNEGNPAPDFVLLDTIAGGSGTGPGEAATWAEARHPGTTYELEYDEAGYELAVRTGG
ncbi:DUF2079 domain-containing protein [Cellulomonas edaphi]|uniref:DUF2079 domain-containing protein n=1 Tax=Cellulomonas edaphi TaxID=3053468 RepID=A0ABT7S3J0_9CELL|nr:DUF2079 domain-containing protein [Cellulomons edaphi]MDM7830187.1 DUF2079 domain-containing protein [Cellulomons edaphi]